MTWLASLGPDATLSTVAALRPGLQPRLGELLTRLWNSDAVSPRILELCRLRVAAILGCETEQRSRTPGAGVDEATIADLPDWPTSGRFTAADRACIAYAEQFAMDAHGVEDDQVAEVRARVGDEGAVALTMGLALFEGLARVQQVLAVEVPDDGRLWA